MCVYFASQQCFPAPETGSATLATRGKIQEVQTACLEFQRVLNSSDGATARTRERERERTMSSTQSHQKDTNVQTGGLESHRWLDTHKRSIMKPWKEKDSYVGYGRIRTYLQKQSQQECHSCLVAIRAPKHKQTHVHVSQK